MNQPLLVGGFPSGGTDLTKTILNAHPDVHLIGEMPSLAGLAASGFTSDTRFGSQEEIQVFEDNLKNLDRYGNLESVNFDFSNLTSADNPLSLETVLRHTFSEQNTDVWGSKTPQFTEDMLALSELLPNAKFLIVVRDVRDVCLSWATKWEKDKLWCASKWAERMSYGLEVAKHLLNDRTHFVKFEQLLDSPQEVCRGICDFVGIPFSTRMLEHHLHTEQHLDGKLNYGQAIKRDNLEKWRTALAPQTVQRIEEIAYTTMGQLDYQPAFASGPRPLTTWELRRGQAHDIRTMITVGNRASQQNTIAQRLRNTAAELRKWASHHS